MGKPSSGNLQCGDESDYGFRASLPPALGGNLWVTAVSGKGKRLGQGACAQGVSMQAHEPIKPGKGNYRGLPTSGKADCLALIIGLHLSAFNRLLKPKIRIIAPILEFGIRCWNHFGNCQSTN